MLEPVIGLEIHIELSTESKMFCSCSTDYFGKKPNSHTCPICLGLPGALPKPNKKAIEMAQKFGLALNCKLANVSKFDRKNYFYPDLPKGFQISQYDLPFSEKGSILIETNETEKTIGITRAHLEEDTGKLNHATVKGKKATLIDFNRSGVPLLEIVSEPQMNSSQEAKAYAQKIQQIARYLEISDADMEKGSMRIEPNVSLRQKGENSLPDYKVELKNINSFRFAQKAIEYEIKRQTKILEKEDIPYQETRGWNETKSQTFSQRSKEEAKDYRYFPEPDIPPLSFNSKLFSKQKENLPELPDKKTNRFVNSYKLSKENIKILIKEKKVADYFEEAVSVGRKHNINPKQIANILINKKPDIDKILPATIIKNIVANVQKVSIDENELYLTIKKVISENEKAVSDYKKGNEGAIMFLLGKVIQILGKNIDYNQIKEKLRKELNK